jgi:predicted DNA-binding protein with PD1-like motif
MKSMQLAREAGVETRVVILDSGEEAFAALTKFANDAGITAASLTAIGAFESATVGWFDFEMKAYRELDVGQQCEVLSAIGDVAVNDEGKASLHLHVVLGLCDGTTRGGHLLKGNVRPTLEVVLTDTPAKLRRKKQAGIGIALIDLDAGKC